MKKLVVTADVHGSYSTWLTIRELVGKDGALAVAGDLFGTRYPAYGDSDYQPELILHELESLPNPFYFVYGNCDKRSFSPGYHDSILFEFMEWKIFLHHGDRYARQVPPETAASDVNLVIQGHTHVFALEKREYNSGRKQIIFLNPGSLSLPRSSFYTYAVIDNKGIDIIDIKTSGSLKSISKTQRLPCQ